MSTFKKDDKVKITTRSKSGTSDSWTVTGVIVEFHRGSTTDEGEPARVVFREIGSKLNQTVYLADVEIQKVN